MQTAVWEHADEFDALATDQNFLYLWLMGIKNKSLMHFSGLSQHQTGPQYTRKEELEYVLLGRDKDWSADIADRDGGTTAHVNLNRLVELLIESDMSAFFLSHWLTGMMVFVVAETVPPEFRPFVLLHEAVEIGLLGVGEDCVMDVAYNIKNPDERKLHIDEGMKEAAKYPHQQACIQELGQVIQQGEEFFIRYCEWLWSGNRPENADNTFDQYCPGFMKEETKLSPAHRVVEFYYFLSSGKTPNQQTGPVFLYFIDNDMERLFPDDWIKRYAMEVKADLQARHREWYEQHIRKTATKQGLYADQ